MKDQDYTISFLVNQTPGKVFAAINNVQGWWSGEIKGRTDELGADWPGGFYCPCHGSKYDISGRVFKDMPAPRNLTIPPYAYAPTGHLVIGVNAAAADA